MSFESRRVESEAKRKYREELEQKLAPDKIALDRRDVIEKELEIESSGLLERGALNFHNVSIDAASLGKKVGANEDAMITFGDESSGFFTAGVFDGLSLGERNERGKGELGSHLLKEEIFLSLRDFDFSKNVFSQDVLKAMQGALENYQMRLNEMGPDGEGADSTLSVVLGFPRQGGTRIFVLTIGDSPVYINEGGAVQKVSVDDGPVESMRFDGTLSDIAAKVHPRKAEVWYTARKPRAENAGSSIPGFPARVYTTVVLEGTEIIVASDGFTDQFREDDADNEIGAMIAGGYSPSEIIAASKLRAAQRIEGLSKNDDISVVRIKIRKFQAPKVEKELAQDKEAGKNEKLPIKRTIESDRKIYQRIKAEKQYAAILAEVILGNLEKRGSILPSDVSDFYGRFPTRNAFEAGFSRNDFLTMIERENGPEKRRQYEDSFRRFVDVMYGSD